MKKTIYTLLMNQDDSSIIEVPLGNKPPQEIIQQVGFQLSTLLLNEVETGSKTPFLDEILGHIDVEYCIDEIINNLELLVTKNELDQLLFEGYVKDLVYKSTDVTSFKLGLLLTYFSEEDHYEVYKYCVHRTTFLPFIRKAVSIKLYRQEILLSLFKDSNEEVKEELVEDIYPYTDELSKELFFSFKEHHKSSLAYKILMKPMLLYWLHTHEVSDDEYAQFTLYLRVIINEHEIYNPFFVSAILPLYLDQRKEFSLDSYYIIGYMASLLFDDEELGDETLDYELFSHIREAITTHLVHFSSYFKEARTDILLSSLASTPLLASYLYIDSIYGNDETLTSSQIIDLMKKKGLSEPLLAYVFSNQYTRDERDLFFTVLNEKAKELTAKEDEVIVRILSFYESLQYVNEEVLLCFFALQDPFITFASIMLLAKSRISLRKETLKEIKNLRKKTKDEEVILYYDHLLLAQQGKYHMIPFLEKPPVLSDFDTLVHATTMIGKSKYSGVEKAKFIKEEMRVEFRDSVVRNEVISVVTPTGVLLGELAKKDYPFISHLLTSEQPIYGIIDDYSIDKPEIEIFVCEGKQD